MVQKPGIGPKDKITSTGATPEVAPAAKKKKIAEEGGGIAPASGKTVGDPQGRTGSTDQQAQTALISLSMSLSGLAKTLEGGNKAKIKKRVGDLLAESESAATNIDALPKKKQATAQAQIQTFLDAATSFPADGPVAEQLGQLITFAQQASGVEAPKAGASFGIGALRPDLEINFQDLTAQDGNTGTAPGGHFLNEATGDRYYVKVAHKGEDMTRNELLMAKLYELAGVEVPHLNPIEITGKLKYKEFDKEFGLASVILEGDIDIENQDRLTSGEKLPGLYEGFAADAWLANWDVAGLTYDNIAIVKQDGEERAVRLDVGGAGPYRAMGSAKPGFDGEVSEMVTLRDTGRAAQAGHIFDKMTDAEVEASVARVVRVSDADVRKVVQQYGPKDKAVRDQLADTLVDRKNDLAKKFPKAVELAATLN